MKASESLPLVRCTFTGNNNVLLPNYLWDGARDIRPGTLQWAKAASAADVAAVYVGDIQITSNIAVGQDAADYSLYFLNLGAPARKIVVNLKNTATADGEFIAVILRSNGITGNQDVSGSSIILDVATGQKRLGIAVNGGAATYLNISTDFNTAFQTLTIIDTGSVISAQVGAGTSTVRNIVSVESTANASRTNIGINGYGSTISLDCIEAWT